MENKNLLIMKQPALGKKISELRKQKGLTQEELVEKCNINVRTIQRIEAGETSPRSFTIKTILEALEADFDISSFTNDIEINEYDRKVLNTAWIFGIIYLVFGFFETTIDVYSFIEGEIYTGVVTYTSIKIISSITFVIFFRGFLKIAKLYSYKLLEIIVYIFMLAYVLAELYDIFLIYFSDGLIVTITVVELLVFGIIQIIFGASLLKLKTKLGTLIQVNGVLEIVLGVCLVTLFLAGVGAFLLIPTTILEIIVIYRLVKK